MSNTDRVYLWISPRGRFGLSYEPHLNFQWWPSRFHFQRNGWHLYFTKLRLTRWSENQP